MRFTLMPATPSSRRPRNRTQGEDVRDTVHTLVQLAKDVTEIANIPFASQAASLMLSILEVAKVKDNDDARDRLLTSVNMYVTRLRPYLDGINNNDPDALRELDFFSLTLQSVLSELQKLRNKRLLKRIFGKGRITTKLLGLKEIMNTSFNTLHLSVTLDTNRRVRDIAENSSREVTDDDFICCTLRGVRTKKSFSVGLFDDAEVGEICATRQRVILKRVASTTERDREARMWSKLRHECLPHLVGYSTDNSEAQFILFHDDWSDTPGHMPQTRSLAAFVLDLYKTHDAISIVDVFVTFINDAIGAIRYMQKELNLTEDEASYLSYTTKYTLNSDRQITIAPPLQSLARRGNGVSYTTLCSLVPTGGASEICIQRYFAGLDNTPTCVQIAKVLDGEQLEKWSLVYSIFNCSQIQILPHSVGRPEEYVIPKTRFASLHYSADIKPGDFGVLDPGESWENAFRRVASPFASLFSHQSWHWLDDRNYVEFDVVRDEPMTWKLDRLTDGCLFTHAHYQRLTNNIHRAKRFLELSAPKDCGVDKLVFVVGCVRIRNYHYTLISGSLEEPQTPDIYAELQGPDNDELRFGHCNPAVCLDYCPLDNRINIDKFNEFMSVKYVTVSVGNFTTNLEIEETQTLELFRHKENESTIRHSETIYDKCQPRWKEWP